MIKILGYDYKLVEDGEVERIGAYGRYLGRLQTLQIATNLGKQQKESTVLHEILEAINYHLELSLMHGDIMSLEAALYQVLVDNGVDISPLLKFDDG